jgi:large subunit ribosomal protein L24
VVEGVNIVTKHIKRGRARQAGLVKVEAPFHVSNVMLVCPTCKEPTRVGVRSGDDGKNARYCKKCDAWIPRPEAD